MATTITDTQSANSPMLGGPAPAADPGPPEFDWPFTLIVLVFWLAVGCAIVDLVRRGLRWVRGRWS